MQAMLPPRVTRVITALVIVSVLNGATDIARASQTVGARSSVDGHHFRTDVFEMEYASQWGVAQHGETHFVLQGYDDLETVPAQSQVLMRGAWIATLNVRTHDEAVRAIVPTYYRSFKPSGGQKSEVWPRLGSVTTSEFAFGGPLSGTLSLTTAKTRTGLLMVVFVNEPSRHLANLAEAQEQFGELKRSIISTIRLTQG